MELSIHHNISSVYIIGKTGAGDCPLFWRYLSGSSDVQKVSMSENSFKFQNFNSGKIVNKWSSRNLAIRMQSFILRFSIATAFYELRADFLDWTADCESRISCNSHAIHTIQGQFSAMPDCNHLTQSSTIQCNPTQLRWIEGGLRVFMRYQCNAGNQTVFEASTRVLSWKSKTHLLRSRNPSQSKGVILQSVPLYHNYKKS